MKRLLVENAKLLVEYPLNRQLIFVLNGVFLTNCNDIIGGCLINKVIQPLGEPQIGMSSPAHHRCLGIIVIGEILLRNMDRKAEILIPQVLCL